MSFTARNIISTLLLLLTYRVNYLSSNTDQLWQSLMQLDVIFPFPYMPPGWTFGWAWSIIYLTLAVYVIWSWTTAAKISPAQPDIQKWFWVTCLFNITWLITTWAEWYTLSFFVIAWLMIILGKMVAQIATYPLSKTEQRTIAVPFGLYYGWISIATTVIGIGQLVYQIDPNIPLSTPWIVRALGLGIIVTVRSFTRRQNRAQLLIALRAFAGVLTSLFGMYSL